MSNQEKTGTCKPLPVCFAYLNEVIILSNGEVTTCCLDAKGENSFGNINEMPLQRLWEERVLPWHRRNVAANERGAPWESDLCRKCLANRYMTNFDAKVTDDSHLLRGFHMPEHPLPVLMLVEVSSACNYSCWGCYAGLRELNRGKRFLDMESFERNILPVVPRMERIRPFFWGEPFLHPQMGQIIRLLRKAGPRASIHISTNGMPMNHGIIEVLVEERVNYLIVSLHGGHRQEGLLRYARQGPDIEVIRENIVRLVRLKRERGKRLPWIFLKALLFDWNDSPEEMEAFLEFGRELGADFTGWDLNMSDPSFSSRRVVPGSAAYDALVRNRQLDSNFYELPAWPIDDEA